MLSTVKVSNIYVEELFDWFLNHVGGSGGDGCGIIVCKNYEEVADWFIEWYKEKYNREFPHPKDIYENGNIINFHDDNENFLFTDDINIQNWEGDYIFIVEKDCKWGYKHKDHPRIQGIN
jgi:hypothetical protein